MSSGNDCAATLAGERGAGTTGQQANRDDTTAAGQRKVEPEFGTSRRGFLVAMLMCGAVKPEAVTRRIVAELEAGE